MAVFCTTVPPVSGQRMQPILPYADAFPYCVLVTSVAFALAALIVGSSVVLVVHSATPEWFREVRHPFVFKC